MRGFLDMWLSTTTKINLDTLNSSTILEIVVNTIKKERICNYGS